MSARESTERATPRYVDPRAPETWPPCACAGPGVYLVRVRPGLGGGECEDRLGDYGEVPREGDERQVQRRYFTVCDGCKVIGEAADAVVGAA